jgi:hypothetical protein
MSSATVLHLSANDATLEAAVEWLLVELEGDVADIAEMRAIAVREMKRPRDAMHDRWARTFLAETERYAEQDYRST